MDHLLFRAPSLEGPNPPAPLAAQAGGSARGKAARVTKRSCYGRLALSMDTGRPRSLDAPTRDLTPDFPGGSTRVGESQGRGLVDDREVVGIPAADGLRGHANGCTGDRRDHALGWRG